MKKQGLAEQESQKQALKTQRTQDGVGETSGSASALSRRTFLGRAAGVTAVTLAAEVVGVPTFFGRPGAHAEAAEIGPIGKKKRRKRAYHIRKEAATFQHDLPLPVHPDNGDEARYPSKLGSYSKALPHNSVGEVDLSAYNALIHALSTGEPADFAAIPLGGTARLTSPQAAYAFALEGPDSHHLGMQAPPAFSSAEEAAEMAELYWQALTRDVPFVEYDTHPLIRQAATDLSTFSAFRGPKVGGVVAPETLFRGNTPGDLTGPYLSQFLWQDVPYGAILMAQKIRATLPGDDYMVAYADWLSVQNGAATGSNQFDPTPRYIRNSRDLAEYVHWDFPYQAALSACLLLLSFGDDALDAGHPYKHSTTQQGFVTFGGPHILDSVARVTQAALKAAWYQKWLVHRRLRPEEFAGRIHNHQTGAASYPIHAEILNSDALQGIFDAHGTYLLPMAYPEGCPTHPAYPSGHASFVGACVTVLRAFFNEAFVIPNPVIASAAGLALVPYTGPALTVGGELNKLAINIGFGRDAAGLHWRSDIIEGLKLGEAVALGCLTDLHATYNEDFNGFTLTKFDGTTITI
ncbi:MAG: vanadium-dependent haloperoxidase [Deltaproteobacteria bacterium]|nr:vanadium-dependent haloperoxidase [Deltaproteobacteria bacterium]